MSAELIATVAVGVVLVAVILTSNRGPRQDMVRVEARLDGRIGALESRMEAQFNELRGEIGKLRERMAHLEGLLEGLREAIGGRTAAS